MRKKEKKKNKGSLSLELQMLYITSQADFTLRC